ncbi:hypothetical protein Q4R67_18155 [Morganella morganii]|uniref:hypothetical protein n=1 Tax=Morganella morganii TaxID=582 RepID=UPI001AD87C11|nr:hypothetical protein [Morganella morganii]ELO7537308.1 hypothetical protein [Morganella morganii]MBO8064146.1 hypothetical protein [Morganella morganii]
MKKLILLICFATFSLSASAAKKLPHFDEIKNKMDNFGIVSATEWKNTGDTNIAMSDGVQYWANDRAVAAVHLLKGKSSKELEGKLIDTASVCLKLSKAVTGELSEEQADDILLTAGYAGKVDDRQVSTFINGYSFFSSIQPNKSEIVFTCGVRQNDF